MTYDNSEKSIEATVIELERLVDRHSLAYVLEMLGRVCREKADHVRTNWQDIKLAGDWDHDADKLEMAACKVFN